MNLGKKLKAARLEAGMTQKELAKKVGVSAQCINVWETGRRHMKLETFERVIRLLGKTVEISIRDNRERKEQNEFSYFNRETNPRNRNKI